MVRREKLEEHQIWLYGAALALGAGFDLLHPSTGERLEDFISSVIAVMLFGMFSQIPFLHLRKALANRQFTAALLTINFIVVPIVVWVLSRFLPDHPPLLLGVYLVLLTPCIDYVIIFTHLGKGNARLVLASTPLLLLAQMLLLPLYLWLFMGEQASQVMRAGPFLEAFLVLIVLPLALALAVEVWAKRQRGGRAVAETAAWLPVPFMALTLLLIAASQISRIDEYLAVVIQAVPIYVAFMIIIPFLARLVTRAFRLDVPAGRALIFSAGIRNSLVVLPLALALPDAWVVASAVVVTQTLVELVGALVYIRIVPAVILPQSGGSRASCGGI